MRSDLIVVAKQWDGLGGRLNAILNAWTVARALDLQFRFVWPRNGRLYAIRNAYRVARALGLKSRFVWPRNPFSDLDPRDLFSDTFLDRYEISRSSCIGRAVILPDLTLLTLPDARELCRAVSKKSMIEMNRYFDVVAFANEPAEVARARFRNGLREIGWSYAAQALIESVLGEKCPREYSVLHLRAGDIVTGDWRQFLPVEKYMPTAYAKFAIETLSGPDRTPVVVVSDNEQYVRQLRAHFNTICTPGDIVAGYAQLTKLQRAFADILLLSRARRIAGPRGSAFSQLGAHLGGRTILGVADMIEEGDARRMLRDSIALTGKDVSDVLRPLLARDICWFLDVFSDDLAVGDQIALARQATRLEPDFCGALNRSASALALVGDRRASQKASLRAQSAAALAIRHTDPLVETLGTSISTKVLALSLGAQRHGRRQPLALLGLTSIGRLKRSLKKCEKLAPFQIHLHDVLMNLRFQIAAAAWFNAVENQVREIAKEAIELADGEPLFLQSWRPSGFSKLRDSGTFPHVLRNLEVLTIRIARAIATALASGSSRTPSLGHIDGITTSPSGLRWVSGWAYDADARRGKLAVGYFFNDVVVSGGVTSLARPDVAAALNDPHALNCGFSFPVPLAVQDKVRDFHSIIRISDRESDLS
jgi:hypothetical protein